MKLVYSLFTNIIALKTSWCWVCSYRDLMFTTNTLPTQVSLVVSMGLSSTGTSKHYVLPVCVSAFSSSHLQETAYILMFKIS